MSHRDTNGTTYHTTTPQRVVDILERYRQGHSDQRLKLHYGDTETGRDWMEIYGVTGYVGRSMGPIRIPILVHNSRSTGGGGILDYCIIKITETTKPHRVLYEHPLYHESVQ